jgi:hypothetical protein
VRHFFLASLALQLKPGVMYVFRYNSRASRGS